MSQTVVFANQKGGVGKTTTAVNIGAYLASFGKKVLLIDFDPQGNLGSSVGVRKAPAGIYEVLTQNINIRQAVQKTQQPNLDLIFSDISLSGATIELVNVENREYYLRKAIASIQKEYDYIFVDCPPSLGLLTLNGFAAAQSVIVPLQCEFFALEGFLNMLFKTIKRIQQGINPALKLGGIVFTMYDSRTRLSQEVIQRIRGAFKDHPEYLFKTIIPRNIRLSEAPSFGKPINLYDPTCVGAKAYEALAKEVLSRV